VLSEADAESKDAVRACSGIDLEGVSTRLLGKTPFEAFA
jgi:hypothetical protein